MDGTQMARRVFGVSVYADIMAQDYGFTRRAKQLIPDGYSVRETARVLAREYR